MHTDMRHELDHLIGMAKGLRDGTIVLRSKADVDTWAVICAGAVNTVADFATESLAVDR